MKALSRRLAMGREDQYDTLRPIADLRKELAERIYVFVQNPLRWKGPEPSDDQKQHCFDAFAENLEPAAARCVHAPRVAYTYGAVAGRV